jgi:hypothetical protein
MADPTSTTPPAWLGLLETLEHETPGQHPYTLSLLLEIRGGPRMTPQQLRPWVDSLRAAEPPA